MPRAFVNVTGTGARRQVFVQASVDIASFFLELRDALQGDADPLARPSQHRLVPTAGNLMTFQFARSAHDQPSIDVPVRGRISLRGILTDVLHRWVVVLGNTP